MTLNIHLPFHSASISNQRYTCNTRLTRTWGANNYLTPIISDTKIPTTLLEITRYKVNKATNRSEQKKSKHITLQNDLVFHCPALRFGPSFFRSCISQLLFCGTSFLVCKFSAAKTHCQL